MRKKRVHVLALILLLLSVVLAVGAATFFGPCVHEDGSVAVCHWAGRAVTALGVVLAVQSLLVLVLRGRARTGAAAAMVPTAICTALMPGQIVGLCMMTTMRCRQLMKPAVLLLSAVLAVLALGTALASRTSEKEKAQ